MELETRAAAETAGTSRGPAARLGWTAKSSRRLGIQVAGWSLLVAGTALLVLPGPGLPVLVAGLALLGKDQPWARRLLERLKDQGGRVRSQGARLWQRIRSAAA